jgi:hypothetical protein
MTYVDNNIYIMYTYCLIIRKGTYKYLYNNMCIYKIFNFTVSLLFLPSSPTYWSYIFMFYIPMCAYIVFQHTYVCIPTIDMKHKYLFKTLR